MKSISVKKKIALFLVGISLIPGFSFADKNNYTEARTEAVGSDDCSRELLLAYFPRVFVNETLKKFNVPSDKWDRINKGLTEKDKEVIKIVEDKASKLNPNPLKDPQQRQTAIKIFRETLLQLFSDVMKSNGVSDDTQIQAMLDDIQQRKAERFAQCMEKQKNENVETTSTDDDEQFEELNDSEE